MTELLPCPFCGGPTETWDDGVFWHVICKSEDCAAMSSPCFTEAEAIAAWNTRAEYESYAALNKVAGLWAKADKRVRNLERTYSAKVVSE